MKYQEITVIFSEDTPKRKKLWLNSCFKSNISKVFKRNK